MNRNIVRSIAAFFITIIVLVLILNQSVFSEVITIKNYYIQLTAIIASVIFIILNIVKPNTLIMYSFNRIDSKRLMMLANYYFYILSFILIFTFSHQIHFVIALIIVMTEFIFIVLNLVLRIQNVEINVNREILRIKDLVFFLLILVLILQNMPFEIYSLPIDSIMIALYTTMNIYICYLFANILHKDLNF